MCTMACLHVCSLCACLMPIKVRKGCQISPSYSLWANMWVLGTKAGSSSRAASTLYPWTVSTARILWFRHLIPSLSLSALISSLYPNKFHFLRDDSAAFAVDQTSNFSASAHEQNLKRDHPKSGHSEVHWICHSCEILFTTSNAPRQSAGALAAFLQGGFCAAVLTGNLHTSGLRRLAQFSLDEG